jgi:hypothetical protein
MTDDVKLAPGHCRLLASVAWLGTAYVFTWGVAGAWGEIPPGFLLWTVVAVPVAVLTQRWLVRLGYEIPRLASLVLTIAWAALCVAIVATARPRVPDPVQTALVAFAAIVTLFGVIAGATAEDASSTRAR